MVMKCEWFKSMNKLQSVLLKQSLYNAKMMSYTRDQMSGYSSIKAINIKYLCVLNIWKLAVKCQMAWCLKTCLK